MNKSLAFILALLFSSNLLADAQDEEAKALLKAFLKPGANHKALTLKLMPTVKDCHKFFESNVADKACAVYQKVFLDNKAEIKPQPEQKELILYWASIENILNFSGQGKYFPGGYKKAANHIKPGIKIYRFKFVEPGKQSGMAYDGLVKLGNRWVFFPKPWKAIK